MNSIVKTTVSPCGKHHLTDNNKKLYETSFDQVLPFHTISINEQLAPVKVNNQAWHIKTSGQPAYTEKYDETFGFYCGLATVKKNDQWFHITSNGRPAYKNTFSFAGNFQQDICVVCDGNNKYFHIDKNGKPLYKEKWNYCGDFREGSSVVQSNTGLSTHILVSGEILHNQWFMDLDVYHKGYARARDQKGWHHIDKRGVELYSTRYANIEPFYNGCSRVEGFSGELLIIDEQGNTLRTIRETNKDLFSELSADMVGYWKTFAISTFVQLGLPDLLPATTKDLAKSTSCSEDKLDRLLSAMNELNITFKHEGIWKLTNKGQYLVSNHTKTLASAALEYSDELLTPWKTLAESIRGTVKDPDVFQEVASNPERCDTHHRMLKSYAIHDYENIAELLSIKASQTVFDAGGSTGAFATFLQKAYPAANVILGDLSEVVNLSDFSNKIDFDILTEWGINADHIILARVLHDWPNEKALTILKNAEKALTTNGQIHVIEMLLNKNDSSGALCDLHLLAATGGQERTLSEFKFLAKNAGLRIINVQKTKTLASLITMESINE